MTDHPKCHQEVFKVWMGHHVDKIQPTYNHVVAEPLLLGEGGGLLGVLQLADRLSDVRLPTEPLEEREREVQILLFLRRHFLGKLTSQFVM